MAAYSDTASMALFCDFENIALGVRDAQYEKFDIRPVLERLLAKGSIVVKKAYCDWERYKGFKAAMHEANFELIEIPHVRQSGKNSADIRMVVDALDLCYTKAHVDTFVIISGDSDFSPLVSKLRENAKKVIGVGVKQSCSDLLVTNCDEFIYYDDLVRDREAIRTTQRREREKRTPEEEARRREKQEERKAKAVDIVASTFVDLIADRGESERIWASVLKEVVKRRNPGFNESYYGFRTFGNLLEEAAQRGLLGFGRDDKGAFVFRAPVRANGGEAEAVEGVLEASELPIAVEATAEVPEAVTALAESEVTPATGAVGKEKGNARRRGGRRGRREESASVPAAVSDVAENKAGQAAEQATANPVEPVVEAATAVPVTEAGGASDAQAAKPAKTRKTASAAPRRGGRKKAEKTESTATIAEAPPAIPVVAVEPAASEVPSVPAAQPKARRTPRPRKPKVQDAS